MRRRLRGDHPAPESALRAVVDAIFYQNRTGCQWRHLRHDLPAWPTVFYCFTP
ncbi:transposase [Streptomyces brevispora]|uniref:transposase n=1 Tax=Streptomyces brevispora TaxID=887462 RepID=UPI003830860F